MSASHLVLCGGTGAHVGVAWLRLHTLGHALGYFREPSGRPELPDLLLLDQDVADGEEGAPTAAQTIRRLLADHPARTRWSSVRRVQEAPRAVQIHPVPLGQDPHRKWFEQSTTIERRFEGSPWLPIVAQGWQLGLSFDRGMMGSPAIGSLLFRLKSFDVTGERNVDADYDRLLRATTGSRTVVVGSGVGGTGASVGPTIADLLADRGQSVMAVMVLNWFRFGDDGTAEIQERAAARNRMLEENGSSALRYYGEVLGRKVAAVPVGAPSKSLRTRRFTGDMQQPMEEVHLHAVAALAAFHHFDAATPFAPGLYVSGAVDPSQVDPRSPIPGDGGHRTLQDLANRAATLHRLGIAAARALRASGGSPTPAIVEVVAGAGAPRAQVAAELEQLLAHLAEQQRWLRTVVGVQEDPSNALDLELRWRRRLATPGKGLALQSDASPARVAGDLYHWLGEWIVEQASSERAAPLVVESLARCDQTYWPEPVDRDAPGVAPGAPAVPHAIPSAQGVLERFVAPDRLSANGWPNPLAMHGWFADALRRKDPVALRMLELLLVGLGSGRLRLEAPPRPTEREPLSLEALLHDLTGHAGASDAGFATFRIVDTNAPGTVYGCTSPQTLVCPTPYVRADVEVERTWQTLFEVLTGLPGTFKWSHIGPDTHSSRWTRNRDVVRVVRHWVARLKEQHGAAMAPPWTRVFHDVAAPEGPTRFHQLPLGLEVAWATEGRGGSLVRVSPPTILSPKALREVDLQPPPTVSPLEAATRLRQSTGSDTWNVQAAGSTWTRFRCRLAGDADERWFVWREHLDALRDERHVGGWFEVETREGARAIVIEWVRGRELERALLRDHTALDLHEIHVDQVHPIAVDPIDPEQLKAVTTGAPARAVPVGSCQLPDLPLRARYLPLLRLRRELDAVSDHHQDDELRARVVDGGERLQWDLPLLGRTDRAPIACPIAAPGIDWRSAGFQQQALRAHWLVWPRFRIQTGAPWRAYYVYFGFGKRDFHAGLVWRDADGHLRLLDDDQPGPHPRAADPGARPVRYEEVGHTGGPPLAVALLEKLRGGQLEERGLYWVPLEPLRTANQPIHVAVDFGTSHSAAAYGADGRERRELRMGADLERAPAPIGGTASFSGATLHVAQSHSLLVDQLLDQGVWLPTYCAAGNGVLPSEFLLQKSLDALLKKGVRAWRPGSDFQLAPMTSGRRQREGSWSQFLVTDFKWLTRTGPLVGLEGDLRVKYLASLLELVLAQIVTERRAGLSAADVTFLWSLRSDEAQVEAYLEDTREACRRVTSATGVQTTVHGYYNESVAARVTGQDGRLCVVADLGGGTLDLFVSIDDAHDQRSHQVVDSVKLGGNVLLDRLAAHPDRFLPDSEAWSQNGAALLRAWMRTLGARRLYGDATGDFQLPLGPHQSVPGYKPADQKRRGAAQQMVFRYFRLVYEFIARYIVAFLLDERLLEVDRGVHLDGIVLQLRGRGWGLHPSHDGRDPLLASLSTVVRTHIQDRVRELLRERGLPADRVALDDPRRYHTEDPKLAPVVQGVHKASSPHDDLRGSRSHALIDLQVLSPEGRARPAKRVDWVMPMPLDTGRSRAVELPGARISPPIPLSEPRAPAVLVGDVLPGIVAQRINEHLRKGDFVDNGVDYLVRPPRFVWEEVFHSDAFTTGLES